MSQTTSVPAKASVPATTPTATTSATTAATTYVDTPSLLNRWQLIGVSLTVLFGVLSAVIQIWSWQSDGHAAGDTEQLVRVQEIQSSLLRADALATNTFLVGGQGSNDQKVEYDAAISSALAATVSAARAQPADREALGVVNAEINDYSILVAQARANNRQNLPVGAAYQSLASQQLRDGALPALDSLVEANTERAVSAMGGQHPFWLLLVSIPVLLGLWWINRNLARTFRRRINVGVAIAGALVFGVSLVTVVGALGQHNANDRLREGEFASAVASATARTAANDAKANESLRLIKRGSGAAHEEGWGVAAETVVSNVPDRLALLWSTYAERHASLVELDDGNDWNGAVTIATTSDEAVGTTPVLNELDAALADRVAEASAAASDELRRGRMLSLSIALLTALLGAAAAFAVSRGIAVRRKEFS